MCDPSLRYPAEEHSFWTLTKQKKKISSILHKQIKLDPAHIKKQYMEGHRNVFVIDI